MVSLEDVRLATKQETQRAIMFGKRITCNELGTSIYRYDGHDYVITSDQREPIGDETGGSPV